MSPYPRTAGFLVQPDFSYDLLAGLFDVSTIPGLTNRFQIQGDSIKLPAIDETSRATGSRWGGVRGYWVAEAGEITKSQPKFRQLELNLKKMAVLCYASDEVLSDARVLEQVIRQSFYDEMNS
jgi:HK97 family phage major capsid protein